MKVNVYSREYVKQLDPSPDTCLISIWSLIALAAWQYADDDIKMDGWHDSMKVEFDDVTHTNPVQGMTVVPFNESMGVTVLDFIEKNKGRPFVIHCDAGMSRSVAVACFMELCYDYSPVYHTINHDGMRNMLVLNILRREWMQRNDIATS